MRKAKNGREGKAIIEHCLDGGKPVFCIRLLNQHKVHGPERSKEKSSEAEITKSAAVSGT